MNEYDNNNYPHPEDNEPQPSAPQQDAVPVYENYYQLYRKIYPALKDSFLYR